MNDEVTLLSIVLAIFFLYFTVSWIQRKTRTTRIMEGLTTSTSTSTSTSSTGIAGDAAAYAAALKSASIKANDVLLISKYRSDYESVIINMDDLVNAKMLQILLTTDITKPDDSLKQLASYQQAKNALNSVMKFVDKSSSS
jgi:hypothetical protein